MLLHNDKENFFRLIENVTEELAIEEALVEKDYYITLFLQNLTIKEPLLVFKGGTCLSKVF
jgi:predicted nucleotidyltransferase component of viral defense system